MSNTCTLNDLTEDLETKLNSLVNANHCGAGVLTCKRSKAELRTRIQSVDRLACEVESIHLDWTATNSSLDQPDLERIAGEIANRITYLEEELVVVEKGESQIQLRSRQPFANENNARSYFEGIVDLHGISLHRYLKAPGERRRAVPTVITRKSLARFGHDLFEIASL